MTSNKSGSLLHRLPSDKFVFSLLIASCIGISSLSCEAAPAAKTSNSGSAIAKLKVDLDTTGIAKTTKVEIVPKDPYSKQEEVIDLNGAPTHVRILFDGKQLKYGDNSFNEPHLLIYPMADYVALFPKERQIAFNKRIATLKKIIANKSVKGVKEIPVLPESDGYEFCHDQEKYLAFNQGAGTGVSYVTVYGNGDPPVNESDFFYSFQGLTADGKYYVAFYWPVKATGMPKDLPLAKSQKYLETLPRGKYQPSLDVLDKVVSSITIK